MWGHLYRCRWAYGHAWVHRLLSPFYPNSLNKAASLHLFHWYPLLFRITFTALILHYLAPCTDSPFTRARTLPSWLHILCLLFTGKNNHTQCKATEPNVIRFKAPTCFLFSPCLLLLPALYALLSWMLSSTPALCFYFHSSSDTHLPLLILPVAP